MQQYAVDIKSTDHPEVVKFHTTRKMFIIVNGKVYVPLEPTSDSHYEWSYKLGLLTGPDDPLFNEMQRGYYKDGVLTAYTGGNDFAYTPELEKVILNRLPVLIESLKLTPDTIVALGAQVGKLGEVWPPIKVLGRVKELHRS